MFIIWSSCWCCCSCSVSPAVQVFALAKAMLRPLSWFSKASNSTASWFSWWGGGLWTVREVLLWNHHHSQRSQHCLSTVCCWILADDRGCWEGKLDLQAWGFPKLLHSSWLEGFHCNSTNHKSISSVVRGLGNCKQMHWSYCLKGLKKPHKGELVT